MRCKETRTKQLETNFARLKTSLSATHGWLTAPRVLLVALACWLLPSLLAQPAKEKTLTDEEFKAAFLSKIPPYISWPSSAFAQTDNQIIVGVLGEDPVVSLLEQLLKGKQVDWRNIVVKVFAAADAISQNCHILFVPAANKDKWLEWSRTKSLPGLLSIGESKEFIPDLGGVFNLSVTERKLEISLKNAKKAGLEIDSKLLKIAKVYK